jgi:hypothetical protein
MADSPPKRPILHLPKKPPQRTFRYVEDGTFPIPHFVAYLDKGANLLIINRDNFAKLTEAQKAEVLKTDSVVTTLRPHIEAPIAEPPPTPPRTPPQPHVEAPVAEPPPIPPQSPPQPPAVWREEDGSVNLFKDFWIRLPFYLYVAVSIWIFVWILMQPNFGGNDYCGYECQKLHQEEVDQANSEFH